MAWRRDCWLYYYTRHGYESHVEWLVTPTPADSAIAASTGADPSTLCHMRRHAERRVSEGCYADLHPTQRLSKTTALCAEVVKTPDPRARALYQHLAAVVAEQVLRTFALAYAAC